MNKVEQLGNSFLQARKDRDEVAKALFSTFKGEYETATKNGSQEGDVTIEKIAKKMVESARVMGNQLEIDLLEPFLPIQMGQEEVRNIVKQVAIDNPEKAALPNKGAFTGLVMKEISGRADASIVKTIIGEEVG